MVAGTITPMMLSALFHQTQEQLRLAALPMKLKRGERAFLDAADIKLFDLTDDVKLIDNL